MIVYTAHFGRIKDILRDPVPFKGVRYVCFTDKSHDTKVWKIVRRRTNTPLFATRLYKCRPYKYFPGKTTLWMDASYELKVDPREIAADHFKGCDMLAYTHPHRTNIRQEAEALVRILNLSPKLLKRQVINYLKDGFSNQDFITVPNFCMRTDNERVRAFGELWWKEYQKYPHGRDQMSIDYCIWKTGIKVIYLSGHYKDNPYATFHKSK